MGWSSKTKLAPLEILPWESILRKHALHCSIESPLSPTALAVRISSTRRWHGWRDGFNNGRFLVAENDPVLCDPDGFSFLVPLNPKWPVVVSGDFHVDGAMTRIESYAAPPRMCVITFLLVPIPFSSGPLAVLWSVSFWLAIFPILLIALLVALGF